MQPWQERIDLRSVPLFHSIALIRLYLDSSAVSKVISSDNLRAGYKDVV